MPSNSEFHQSNTPNGDSTPPSHRCTGWWQQTGLGRQTMHDLSIQMTPKYVWGSGNDIISPFTLEGRVRTDGAVELIKQYKNRHSVLYVGQYDGEGTLAGTWDIHGYRGLWLIKFLGPKNSSNDAIQEIQPL